MPRYTTALGSSLGGLLKGIQAGQQGRTTGEHQAIQDAYMMAQMDALRGNSAAKADKTDAEIAQSQAQQTFAGDPVAQYGGALELNGLSSGLAKGVADYLSNPTPGKYSAQVDMPQVEGLPSAAPVSVSYGQEAPGGLDARQLAQVQRTKGLLGMQYDLTGKTDASGLTKAMMDLLGRQDMERVMASPDAAQGLNLATAASKGDLYASGRDPGTTLNRGTGAQMVSNNPLYRAGLAETQANTAADRARANLSDTLASSGKAPPGYRWTTDGRLEPIPGGPADPASKSQNKGAPSEDERKAAGWVAQAQKALNDMNAALEVDPSASQPGVIESLPFVPEAVRNYSRSPQRQQFNQASSAFAEAALRAATGAGVNEQEARQKTAELTPQWGDSTDDIRQKQASLQMYLDSLKLRAGRALPQSQQNGSRDSLPPINAMGWVLHRDAQGNMAYVSPDGQHVEEVQ